MLSCKGGGLRCLVRELAYAVLQGSWLTLSCKGGGLGGLVREVAYAVL